MSIKLLIIITCSIFIFIFLILAVSSSKKKLRREEIKIEDAYDSINTYLDKKKKAINKSKNLIDIESYKNNFNDKFNDDNLEKLYNHLNDIEDKFNYLFNDDEKISSTKTIINLKNNLRDINSNLTASIKYYNDSIDKYYNLKKTRPTKYVKFLSGFKLYDKFKIKGD